MEYRRLGKSGLQISCLSLGSWLTFGKQIEDSVAEQLMHYAYDQGVNFFDNAEIYAQGKSEIVMGNILKNSGWDRTSYLVSSKVFFGDGRKKPNQTGLSRKHIWEACDAALRRLQVDYIDLFYCHRPDPNVSIDEVVWSMHLLIQQGKILYWGTSEWSGAEIQTANEFAIQHHLIGPVVEQPEYNLFNRFKVEEDYKSIYSKYGLGTTIWSPLASGVLSGKFNSGSIDPSTRMAIPGLEWLKDKSITEVRLAKVQKISLIAKQLGISMPQLAIAWCLNNPNVSSVILGASRLEQLKENIATLEHLEKVNQEVVDELNGI